MFEILTKKKPFFNFDNMEVVFEVVNREGHVPIPTDAPASLKNVMEVSTDVGQLLITRNVSKEVHHKGPTLTK